MKKISLLLVAAILLCACPNWLGSDYPVEIENKSELIISSYFALGQEAGETAYPDTTLLFDKKWVGYDTKPGNIAKRALHTFTYEEWFAKLPQDTLSIFIFSTDTLDKYHWTEIQSSYNILQRYDLSLGDFIQLSDKYGVPILTYPPTENMKNMKMYPPYEE